MRGCVQLWRRCDRAGMTLGDTTVAVAVLAVLLAILVPQFRSHELNAAGTAGDEALQALRNRIEVYRFRNDGRLPGEAGTEADFLADLQLSHGDLAVKTADLAGSSPARSKSSSLMPPNPHNGSNRIHVGDAPPRGSLAGWWYQPQTGDLRAIERSPG
jgi:type II secretory pathway pseudopilin PulG